MLVMPKKKGPIQIYARLKPTELAEIDSDRKAMSGIPPSRSAYARAAVIGYAKLRKLEELIRRDADQTDCSKQASPMELLAEAGL